MSRTTTTLAQKPKPRILQTPDGRRAIVAATSPAIRAARVQAAEGSRFLALGYQQTDLPASKGGLVLNSKGFRFRPRGMRALARTFRGNPFITAHDWGDVRARGGTIADAYTEEIEQLTDAPTATGIYYEINATADWAIEGLENGTIDRFSLGVVPQGEVMCTAHDVPVWTGGCWCFPGEAVVIYEENAKGEKVERDVVAEWEYAGGIGVELSCVNVAAVDGTHIIDTTSDDEEEGDEDIEAFARDLALLCGRSRPRAPSRTRAAGLAAVAAAGAAPAGGFTPAAAAPNMTESPPTGEHQMDRIALCRRLNLPSTASDDEINARLDQAVEAEAARGTDLEAARTREAALAKQVLDQHVEAELARLTRDRQVQPADLRELRATATASGRAAFDKELGYVERNAPRTAPPVGAPRAALQSDAPALAAPAAESDVADGVDAYEQHKDNAALPKLMRACKITADNIRKHGPKAITVVPDLAELSARTNAR